MAKKDVSECETRVLHLISPDLTAPRFNAPRFFVSVSLLAVARIVRSSRNDVRGGDISATFKTFFFNVLRPMILFLRGLKRSVFQGVRSRQFIRPVYSNPSLSAEVRFLQNRANNKTTVDGEYIN